MIGEDDDGTVADFQIFGADYRTFVCDVFDFTAQRLRVDDRSVSQYIHNVLSEDTGRKQMQGEFSVLIHHRMSRVVPALIADHNIIIFSDQVDHTAFAFITPVDTNNSTDCHFVLQKFSCLRQRGQSLKGTDPVFP